MRKLAILVAGMTLCIAACLTGSVTFAIPLANRGQTAPAQPAVRPAASIDTISSNGIDPQAISLYWTTTSDVCFDNYTLGYSTAGSNGPWYIWDVFTSSADTSGVILGVTPGTTYWWSIFDYDCLGHQQGNAYQATQPSVPTLSVTEPTETSATLSWGNPASYGGGLAFASYSVTESINGVTSVVDTISVSTNTGYSATGLSLSTVYSFYIVTTDTASGSAFTASRTSTVSITTPAPLAASSSANPATINTGQSVALTCTASGGVSPYTYAWTFGDTQTGSGASPTHSYGSAGTFTATCTVTDAHGLVASSSVIITVNPTVAGLPAAEGYAVIGGSIAAVVIILAVVALLVLRRRKARRPPPQPYSQTPPASQPPGPPAQ
jgi:chitodextrinase